MAALETRFAIFLAAVIAKSSLAFGQVHNGIVENLMSFGNTQLAIFVDSNVKDISEILDIERLGTTVKIFNSHDIWTQTRQISVCDHVYDPSVDPVNWYNQFYAKYLDLKHHTIVVYVRDAAEVMEIFDKTVKNCTIALEPGIFHLENRFLFIVHPDDYIMKYSREVFASSQQIVKHR